MRRKNISYYYFGTNEVVDYTYIYERNDRQDFRY